MQNPVSDERYSVADEAILGAFFKLVKKKTTDQITVSDITKTAGIARSTFYNHYQDIPSLVSAVEEKTIHDVFSIMEKFHPENDHDICQSYFLTICRYTMENPFLSSLLSTPHGNDLLNALHINRHNKNPSEKFTQTGFYYACGSSIRTSCLLIFFVVLRINGFFRITRPVIRR